jgi:predicted Zn finger-like uncharacterized protein
MEALDGNAIAGALFDAFGTEMTTAFGTCANCRTRSRLAEMKVYLRGPGVVVRCPSCGNVVLVLVGMRGLTCVDATGLAVLQAE